jgi:hypothetical protein
MITKDNIIDIIENPDYGLLVFDGNVSQYCKLHGFDRYRFQNYMKRYERITGKKLVRTFINNNIKYGVKVSLEDVNEVTKEDIIDIKRKSSERFEKILPIYNSCQLLRIDKCSKNKDSYYVFDYRNFKKLVKNI